MRAVVYFNWGRWVADCPDPDCNNAEEFGRGLRDVIMVCANCKQSWKPDWPAERNAIEQTLAARPVPGTRNWWPSETVADLVRENVENGVG